MITELIALLTDAPTLCLLATALLTAAYSSYRANDTFFKRTTSNGTSTTSSPSEQFVDENRRLLEGSTAIAFPVIATISIVFLFFFIHSIGVILTLLSTFSSVFAVMFFLWPLAELLVSRLRALGVVVHTHTTEAFIVVSTGLFIIFAWLFTGNWIPNNIIGISLCVLFASLCKVPNLKVTCLLFAGLFVYDIFFVFFSEKVFGRNVMVEVATSAPTNPIAALADFLHLPFKPVQNLALPAKLIVPAGRDEYAILGLGDIILPQILLTYLLELDLLRPGQARSWRNGYFFRAVLAYAFALFMSFYCNFVFRNAQPALLYIVPALLFTTLLYARSLNEVSIVWDGLHHRTQQVVNETIIEQQDSGKDLETTALVP
ncbi:Signal peptide peptidase-like 1 [Gracilariopsis chorda]|uniref:Signal peptide peptidase-like 1 n=1 Tax=Gracilariopsis chorda TaxID=448386 RepID=A0A2V3IE13_9FLOR|nr:Signal peptide peptidase-like 1 [Gracilariopsis chorda]|eukprot:PXF40313.1 Signal peptide peptidase-like 1 [Gracilariopsis chorda]